MALHMESGGNMKRKFGVFALCACLLFPARASAREMEAMELEGEIDVPGISEEVDALIGDVGQSESTEEFYRLLKKDAALSAYGADIGEGDSCEGAEVQHVLGVRDACGRRAVPGAKGPFRSGGFGFVRSASVVFLLSSGDGSFGEYQRRRQSQHFCSKLY